MTDIVGRLAPSPTGVLHVGNARSLLWAWLSARAANGRVLLRIEDLLPGSADERAAAAASVLDDLRWLGLDWDAPPADTLGAVDPASLTPSAAGLPPVVLQSQRTELYRSVAQRLARAGLVYPCVCTRKDIALASRAPHAEEKGRPYPGTCRDRFADEGAALRWEGAHALRLQRRALGCALRLRVSSAPTQFHDEVCGPQQRDLATDSGDFVVRKKDGDYAYMFAVVVDDLTMGINEIIRGDDLLDCTAQHVAVYRAIATHCTAQDLDAVARRGSAEEPQPLRSTLPTWHHIGLVHGQDGRRLAKRDRAIHVRQLAADGVSPQRLRRWLAGSMGLPDTGDLPSLIAAWATRTAPANPLTFLRSKLD